MITSNSASVRLQNWLKNGFFDEQEEFHAIEQDFSEFQQASQAVQFLIQIVDFLPDPTFVIDCSGRVIMWNRAIEDMTGIKAEDIIGKNNYEYSLPFYHYRRPILIDLVLEKNKSVEKLYSFANKDAEYVVETQVKNLLHTKDRVLWGKASPLFDKNGSLVGAIESIRDITEQKNAERNLALSEEKFAKAFNFSPSLIAIINLVDGIYVDVNDTFCQAMGYQRQEVIGRTLKEIGLCSELEHSRKIRSNIIRKKSIRNIEIKFLNRYGEERIGIFSSEIFSLHNKEYVIVSITDISERKRIEQEMARLDQLHLIGEMAASIGHEIRNPMTTVRGFLQMLMSRNIKEADYYEIMIEELDRANSIIVEFLALAKNKAIDLKSYNLNSILAVLQPLLNANAINSNQEIDLVLNNISDVFIDEKEIRQLILNLVRNGFEAMQPGGILTIKTYESQNNVILEVQDQGQGIDPQVMEKLGTPFISTKENGTGLGLPVCYSIAERNSASIDVETGPDGTTFIVKFIKSK